MDENKKKPTYTCKSRDNPNADTFPIAQVGQYVKFVFEGERMWVEVKKIIHSDACGVEYLGILENEPATEYCRSLLRHKDPVRANHRQIQDMIPLNRW